MLLAAAALAGWLDAVAGGGGLVQLPALLLAVSAASPAQVLATNKIASLCGTAVSSLTYARAVPPDPRTLLPMAGAAIAGSAGGAACAGLLSREVFRPAVLVLLVVVGCYVWRRPTLGEREAPRWTGRRGQLATVTIAGGIGFYDGIFGPGTGSFLVVALVGIGFSVLAASATAKVTNLATNAGALLVFVPQGAPMWRLALLMGLANLTGGFLGARAVLARGGGFVRVVLLVVVSALVLRLGWETVRG